MRKAAHRSGRVGSPRHPATLPEHHGRVSPIGARLPCRTTLPRNLGRVGSKLMCATLPGLPCRQSRAGYLKLIRATLPAVLPRSQGARRKGHRKRRSAREAGSEKDGWIETGGSLINKDLRLDKNATGKFKKGRGKTGARPRINTTLRYPALGGGRLLHPRPLSTPLRTPPPPLPNLP